MDGFSDLLWIIFLIVIFNSIAKLKNKRTSSSGEEESRSWSSELFDPEISKKTAKQERDIVPDTYEDIEDFSDEVPDWIEVPWGDDSIQRPDITFTPSEVSGTLSSDEIPGENKVETRSLSQSKSSAEITKSETPLLNLSPAGVLGGIVWSEILQPPRCQRPYHRQRRR